MERVLENAGLTRIEGKAYLALLEAGSATAGEITRITGIHRRTIYDVMERLIEKGLIGYVTINDRKYFQVSSPERLVQLVDQKKREIDAILPNLLARHAIAQEKQEVVFYRGKEGLKTIFESQIESGKEILIMGGSMHASEILRFYFEKYDRKRIEKKIKIKMVFYGKKIKTKIPLAEVKYLPENYAGLAATNIWNDSVAIILWSENPFAILIKDKQIADSYRNHFRWVFSIAKR